MDVVILGDLSGNDCLLEEKEIGMFKVKLTEKFYIMFLFNTASRILKQILKCLCCYKHIKNVKQFVFLTKSEHFVKAKF